MIEKEKQEMCKELDDEELSQINGGAANSVATNLQRNLNGFRPNSASVANIQGQSKYKINRLGNSISVTVPKQTNDP